ncbi:MAG: prolipoprotein diacylglyceryl transferase, partial [Spirochaetia bacterium]|nr:prolipoprotein diacylglyceryl transferase [Spirochaetia bacterium]
SFWQNTDLIVTAIPFGYFFGRLGNFINGELYGRVTDSGIGMIFPYAERFSIKEQWVSDIVSRLDIPVSTSGMANLPRYPSQLFEAFFEGIVLGIIMWIIFKKVHDLRPGTRTGIYLAGYGIIRFFIEYFREPDADLGFILKLSGQDNPIYLLNSLLDFSMGQLLCTLMILTGVLVILLMNRKSKA